MKEINNIITQNKHLFFKKIKNILNTCIWTVFQIICIKRFFILMKLEKIFILFQNNTFNNSFKKKNKIKKIQI